MITRRSAAVILSAASLGLVAAAVGPASAHPGGDAQHAENGSKAGAKHGARGARGMARVIRNCSLSDAELVAVEGNARLTKISERLAERVADESITQEQADARLARAQKRVTIRAAMNAARHAPVLELFGVSGRTELRDAAVEAGGLRKLIAATDGVTVADFRAARRDGAKAGRAAVTALCADDDA